MSIYVLCIYVYIYIYIKTHVNLCVYKNIYIYIDRQLILMTKTARLPLIVFCFKMSAFVIYIYVYVDMYIHKG